ncbi:MAG: hypothetical protein M3Z03_12595 [Actinomycetota bacterium]|nr:hypothetical protein [Actinomycetota bacterium]
MTLGPGVGRSALRGAVVGFVFMATAASVVALAGGLSSVNALGIATFAAVWVGPGFGVLFGAIFAITRNEQAEALALAEIRGGGGASS